MKIFQDIKITLLFWLKVFGKILLSLDITGAIMNSIPSIITVFLVSIFSGVEISKIDTIKIAWTEITGKQPDAWLTVVTISFVYIAIGILYQPAKLYKELGGFIEKPLKITARDRVKDNRLQSQPRSGSITIENILPKKSITDCVLTIDSIKDVVGLERLYSQQRRVSWSSGFRSEPSENQRINREIEIRPGMPVVADLFETRNDDTIIPTTWSPHPPLPVGKYDVFVTAHGRLDGIEVKEEKIFSIIYSGKNNIEVTEKKIEKRKGFS